MKPPDDLLTEINKDDVKSLKSKITRNEALNGYQKKECAVYLNLACLFNDKRFRELRLEESVTLDRFMDSSPVPPQEKSLDHLIKKFPVKCNPSEAIKILEIKMPLVSRIKKAALARLKCRIFLPKGGKVNVPETVRNGSLALLHKFQFFASTKELTDEAAFAKYLQLYLENTELPKKLLYNYLRKQLFTEPLVFFRKVTKEDEIRKQAKKMERKGKKPDPLLNLKTENKILQLRLNDLKKEHTKLKTEIKKKSKYYDYITINCDHLSNSLRGLRKNLFVNSVQVSCVKPCPHSNSTIHIMINDLYDFKEPLNGSFDVALNAASEKATKFMNQLINRGCEDVIPRKQRNDTMLLVALFELKTGFSIENVIVNLSNVGRRYKWTAKAVIDGVLCSSDKSNRTKLHALNGLFSKFLLEKQSCVISS